MNKKFYYVAVIQSKDQNASEPTFYDNFDEAWDHVQFNIKHFFFGGEILSTKTNTLKQFRTGKISVDICDGTAKKASIMRLKIGGFNTRRTILADTPSMGQVISLNQFMGKGKLRDIVQRQYPAIIGCVGNDKVKAVKILNWDKSNRLPINSYNPLKDRMWVSFQDDYYKSNSQWFEIELCYCDDDPYSYLHDQEVDNE